MLSQNIKSLRTQKGLTQKELADLLHVTPQAISRWEQGDVEPSVDAISNMAKIFEVTTDEIISGTPATPKQEVVQQDVATTATAPQEKVVETVVEKFVETPKPVLALCEKCKRPIYDSKDIVIKHTGRTSAAHYYCMSCDQKEKERQRLAIIEEAKSNRIKSYIWGGVGAISMFLILFGIVKVFDDPEKFWTGIAVPIATFTLISCLILNNNFIGDVVAGIAGFSIRMPGIIFSLDLDGIIWLLTVKLALFLLGIALSIFCFFLAIIVGLALSIIVYPFALYKNINHPEDTN